MSDWDAKRERSKSYRTISPPKRTRFYSCQCVKCGMNYMVDTPPYSIPGAMSDKGFLCKNCRPHAPKYAPSPPPENVQVMIDEYFGAKK